MSKLINMLGVRVGAREVVAYAGNKRWLTKCDCGAEVVMDGVDIRRNRVTTCSHKTGYSVRFFLKVKKTNSCWVWTGSKQKDGYGTFRGNNKTYLAHRWAYINRFGEIQGGLELDHICRNRACVNPEHLELVTHKVNVHRGNMPSIVKARGFLAERMI